ncbi:MAG: Hsp20/alpha crystallin family protein [Desulfovibrionales bacterium]
MLEQFFPAIRRRSEVRKGEESPWDVFDQILRSPGTWPEWSRLSPPVEVTESSDVVKVKAELPGMDPEDISVTVENNTLVIQGEKKEERSEKEENSVMRETRYGSFYRTIPLPSQIKEEKIKASFKKGVLKITLPKHEKAKTKQIEIA